MNGIPRGVAYYLGPIAPLISNSLKLRSKDREGTRDTMGEKNSVQRSATKISYTPLPAGAVVQQLQLNWENLLLGKKNLVVEDPGRLCAPY